MIQVLLFTAPWCEPCKTLKPGYNELVTEMTHIEFYTVDVSETPKLANAHKVRSVPTVIIMDNEGEVLERLTNPYSKEQIKLAIEGVM